MSLFGGACGGMAGNFWLIILVLFILLVIIGSGECGV